VFFVVEVAMPSPFPGMNPYLEHPRIWHGFHERFITRLADALELLVGSKYLVMIDEHVYLQEVDEDEVRFLGRADIALGLQPSTSGSVGGAVLLEPPTRVSPLLIDEVRENFVKIYERDARTVVTVVELLSPANKTSDRQQYLLKRSQVMRSPAHLVEIDLLRGGQRLPYKDLPACDYCVMVSRINQRPEADFWPIGLRQPLPKIPIPLKLGDSDLQIDLQELVHQIHDAAGYAKYIYENDLIPPLSAADAAWAQEVRRT
jgi:hypothetical protein